NLDKKIERLLKQKYLVSLKRGWYVSQPFLDKQLDLDNYTEYLANKLRSPSYLSLDYALSKYNLIPEAINSWTSITSKSTRTYQNILGLFNYKSIKKDLFMGYEEISSDGYDIYLASKAKALFDFLYLKRNLGIDLDYELSSGLRINWAIFLIKDLQEFAKYVRISKMEKMQSMLNIIKGIKNVN
ncbi:hypothetical protein KJ628_04750, partial [Patescibacteria group bacterium]|nr:hypothetical protein [Patescibacteria group bacterium]